MVVGYMMTTKQYRLYNLKTRAFIKSRDVVFYENTPFFQQTSDEIFLPSTNDIEEDAGPTTRSKATKFCSVMASTRDSDSRNSGPSRNTPGGEKPDDPIQALQDVLQRSRARRCLALESEASTQAGPADGYRTPVIRNRKKTPMTAAEKHEKTVNALRTGLDKYWEGRGISKRYEAGKGKGRDDSEPESTSKTIAQAGAATEERDEEEDEDDEPFFEPNLVFMVNNGPNTIEEALRGADKDHWMEAINTELDSLENH